MRSDSRWQCLLCGRRVPNPDHHKHGDLSIVREVSDDHYQDVYITLIDDGRRIDANYMGFNSEGLHCEGAWESSENTPKENQCQDITESSQVGPQNQSWPKRQVQPNRFLW